MDYKALHKELNFRTSRSSGAGGQHVNKVASRVELLFDIDQSYTLSNAKKELIKQRLRNRINKEGILIIASEVHRSQYRNKKETIQKFDELIQRALKPRPKRKKVKPLTANREKRLQKKKQRAEKKAWRKKIDI